MARREVRNPWTRIADLEEAVAELKRRLAEDHDRLAHLDVHKVGGLPRPTERR